MSGRPQRSSCARCPLSRCRSSRAFHQHRLLTPGQVHALHMPTASLRWTQHILASSRARVLADCGGPTRTRAVVPHQPWRRDDPDQPARTPSPLAPYHARPGIRPPTRHTLAVNDTGIAFVKAARERTQTTAGPSPGATRSHTHSPTARGAGRSSPTRCSPTSRPPPTSRSHSTSGSSSSTAARSHPSSSPPSSPATPSSATTHPPPLNAPQRAVVARLYRTFPAVLVVLADQTPAHARRRIQRVIALYRTDPTQSRYGTVPISFVTLAELTSRGPLRPSSSPPSTPKPTWTGSAGGGGGGRREREEKEGGGGGEGRGREGRGGEEGKGRERGSKEKEEGERERGREGGGEGR